MSDVSQPGEDSLAGPESQQQCLRMREDRRLLLWTETLNAGQSRCGFNTAFSMAVTVTRIITLRDKT